MSFAETDLLCMQRPSVQFLDCRTRPSQSLPPFLGAGAVHSLLRQCVHSVPQVDHLLQDVHLPSTVTEKTQDQVKGRGSSREQRRAELKYKCKTKKLEKLPHRGVTTFLSTPGSGACSAYVCCALRALPGAVRLFPH